MRTAADAYRRVPAYRAFLDEQGAGSASLRALLGEGPFAVDAAKIKQTRIIKVTR